MPTYTDLLTSVRDMLSEPTAAQWSDAMLRRWINEAAIDLARVTRHVKRFDVVPVLANTPTIQLTPDIIAVEVVNWAYDANSGHATELTPVHYEEWTRVTGGAMTRVGDPAAFTIIGSQPNIMMALNPAPYADGNLYLHNAVLPLQIADDGTDDALEVDFPLAWQDALVDYAEYRALRRDRDPRWQEAYNIYREVRDALVVSPDYLAISRNMIPDPMSGMGGYVPEWLAAFD